MSAYVVGLVEVSNWDGYREYMRHTPRLIQQFGGRIMGLFSGALFGLFPLA